MRSAVLVLCFVGGVMSGFCSEDHGRFNEFVRLLDDVDNAVGELALFGVVVLTDPDASVLEKNVVGEVGESTHIISTEIERSLRPSSRAIRILLEVCNDVLRPFGNPYFPEQYTPNPARTQDGVLLQGVNDHGEPFF